MFVYNAKEIVERLIVKECLEISDWFEMVNLFFSGPASPTQIRGDNAKNHMPFTHEYLSAPDGQSPTAYDVTTELAHLLHAPTLRKIISTAQIGDVQTQLS